MFCKTTMLLNKTLDIKLKQKLDQTRSRQTNDKTFSHSVRTVIAWVRKCNEIYLFLFIKFIYFNFHTPIQGFNSMMSMTNDIHKNRGCISCNRRPCR